MKNNSKTKKAQALPLNTIVIAILVIIVLLVIVVFFTSKIGETSEQLGERSVVECSLDNPALAALNYKSVNLEVPVNDECPYGEKISIIPSEKDEEGNVLRICCGTK